MAKYEGKEQLTLEKVRDAKSSYAKYSIKVTRTDANGIQDLLSEIELLLPSLSGSYATTFVKIVF